MALLNPNLSAIEFRDAINSMHVQVQELTVGMGTLRSKLTEVHSNILPTAETVVKKLKMEIDELYGKTERTIITIQAELTRLANTPPPTSTSI